MRRKWSIWAIALMWSVTAAHSQEPPPPPSSVHFALDGETLTWSPVGGATSYNVYQGTYPLAYDHECRVLESTTTSTLIAESPTQSGELLYFLVASVNSAGEGPLSDPVGGPVRPNTQPCVDTDGDQVPDNLDNCGDRPNPGQEDFDGDGYGDECDLVALLDILESVEEGNWVKVNENLYQDVWAPPDLQPLFGCCPTSPHKIIYAWSSFAWDSNRGNLMIYGGGHANASGNDMYVWNGSTRLWERGSVPSEVVYDPVIDTWNVIDGVDAAPISAHTYDNNIFLPLVDRFLAFGGAAHSHGGAYYRRDDSSPTNYVATGPYDFDPSKADPQKVGGTDGSHVQREAPHPEITGGQMWQNRDSYANVLGDPEIPGSFVDGVTAYAEEAATDVVYVGGTIGGSTQQHLYKYTIPDADDPTQDTWESVGDYWNGFSGQGTGTFDPVLNLFVRTTSDRFVYWDLSTPGPGNRNMTFNPVDPTGEFVIGTGYGMDYDSQRHQYGLWQGDGVVWMMYPPASVGTDGWTIYKQPTPTSEVPAGVTVTGILGKWKYISDLDAFMGLRDPYAGNVWLYKPIGWTRPGDIPSGPEIVVFFEGANVQDGAGSVDYGTTVVGVPVAGVFTVHNTGTEDLLLGAITVPPGYRLAQDFGQTTLTPGATTGFTVELEAMVAAVYSGTVSFDSNDANESPFDFVVSGTVTENTGNQVFVVDDGDAGFVAIGGWTSYVGSGAQGDFSYKVVGSGTETATWTLTGLTPGQYRVSATWEPFDNRAVDAPYTILDDGSVLTTVSVDQRQSPVDFFEDGVGWHDLGADHEVTTGILTVELSDLASPAGSYVIADAIRIERVADLP